jgi:capsular exopolysaccharide synthesis family protein
LEILKIWEILLRRKSVFLGVFLAFLFTVILVTHLSTPVYRGTSKILVKAGSDPEASLLGALGLKSTSNTSKSSGDEYDTDIELSMIRPLLDKLVNDLQLKTRDDSLMDPDQLTKLGVLHKTILPQPYIKVVQHEEASMLKIMAYSTEPQEAVDMANKLAEFYINDRIERTKSEYRNARLHVESMVNKARDEYYAQLVKAKDYRLEEGFVDIDKETDILLNKVSSLRTAEEENEKSILEIEKRHNLISEKFKETEKFREASKVFSENAILKSLQTELKDVLIEAETRSIDITKEHPAFKTLEKKLGAISELMKKEEELLLTTQNFSIDPMYDDLYGKLFSNYVDKVIAVSKRDLIKIYIDVYHKELMKIPVRNEVVAEFNADTSIYKSLYQSLLGYLTQVNVAETIALSNISVVENAVLPEKPSFPKKFLNYLAALFLGSFLGLIATLFVDYIDNTIRTPGDVKNSTGLELIGAVPDSKLFKDSSLVSGLDPVLPEVDAFRTVKNNIKFIALDKTLKSIALTSAYESEGKSMVASNASIMLAMENKRVLLADMNMINPSVHEFFYNIDSSVGMIDVISGRKVIKDVIQKSSIEGLDTIPMGPLPSDAARMVHSDKLRDVLNEMKSLYDVVIIDTPPIMLFNDTMLICKLADSVINVMESGKVSFAIGAHIKDMQNKASLNVAGVVLNRFKI